MYLRVVRNLLPFAQLPAVVASDMYLRVVRNCRTQKGTK